jgi:hypothetical protein
MESRKIKWRKVGQDAYTALAHRGFTAQITMTGGASAPYQLLIQPGAVASSHKTLRNAKNQFRLFLQNKPVSR